MTTQNATVPFWKTKTAMGIAFIIVLIPGVILGKKLLTPNPYSGVPKQAVIFFNQGNDSLDQKRIESALGLYLKAINLDDSFADAYSKTAEAYFMAGLQHKTTKNQKMQDEMFSQANTYLKKALDIDADNGEAHFVLGLMADEKGKLDEAISEMEKAEAQGVSSFVFHSSLGYLYNSKEEAGKSIEQYRKAIALKSDDAKTLFNLGELYFAVGNYEKAVSYYSELLKYEPENSTNKVNYASALWKNGDADKAKKIFNQILESAEGKSFRNYNTVAWALIDKDVDYEWGIALAKTAAELKKNNIESMDILGWGYFKNKEYAKAVEYLTRSYQFSPSEEVKKRIEMAKAELAKSSK